MISSGSLGFLDQDGPFWVKKSVSAFEWNPKQPVFIIGTLYGELEFWSPIRRAAGPCFKAHSAKIVSISHRKDGEFFATGSEDGIIHIWYSENASKMRSLNLYTCINSLNWSDDGTRLAIAHSSKVSIVNLIIS